MYVSANTTFALRIQTKRNILQNDIALKQISSSGIYPIFIYADKN